MGVWRQTAAAIFSNSSKGSASMSDGADVGWLGGDCKDSVEEKACASVGENAGGSYMDQAGGVEAVRAGYASDESGRLTGAGVGRYWAEGM